MLLGDNVREPCKLPTTPERTAPPPVGGHGNGARGCEVQPCDIGNEVLGTPGLHSTTAGSPSTLYERVLPRLAATAARSSTAAATASDTSRACSGVVMAYKSSRKAARQCLDQSCTRKQRHVGVSQWYANVGDYMQVSDLIF